MTQSHGTNRSNRKRYRDRVSNTRRKIKHETSGRKKNLGEDFTESDFKRMEAAARRAMDGNRKRIWGA